MVVEVDIITLHHWW